MSTASRSAVADEAAAEPAQVTWTIAGSGPVEGLVEPRRDVLAGRAPRPSAGPGRAPRRPAPPPAVAEPALDVGERAGGVAAVGLQARAATTRGFLASSGAALGSERGDGPPRQAELAGAAPHVGQAAVGRGARGRSASPPRPRRSPRRPRGTPGWWRTGRARGCGPARGLHDDVGAGRQLVEQQYHVVDQDRGERLHALDRDALGDLAEHVGQPGVRRGQRGSAFAHGSSVSSSSRQGGAHSPCSADLEASAGRRP